MQSENEPIQSNQGCIKPRFSTGNYFSIDEKNCLKWHVFEGNARSVFVTELKLMILVLFLSWKS